MKTDETKRLREDIARIGFLDGCMLSDSVVHEIINKVPDALLPDEISGALARGYCTDRNEHKVVDPDLIEDMATEVKQIIDKLRP